MAKATSLELIVITSPEQIPTAFSSEKEEAIFWDTHTLSDEMWSSLEEVEDGFLPLGPMGLSLVIDPDVARRLRQLAKKKGVSYVKLAQQFVVERVYEEEKREGIIGDREAS